MNTDTNMDQKSINRDEFLALFPDTRFRYIHDSETDANGNKPIKQGTNTLDLSWNKRGFGTFFTVNGFPPTGEAKAANLVSLGASYIDFDVDPKKYPSQEERDRLIQETIMRGVEAGIPTPTFVNRTWKGAHLIWLYPEKLPPTPENIAWWRNVQKRLVHFYNGDKNCTDPTRVLRVPYTLHLKNPQNPFEVYVQSYKPECRPTLKELDAAVPRYSEADGGEDKLPISTVFAGLPTGKGLRHAGIAQVAGYYLRNAKTQEEVDMARIALYAWDKFQNKSPEPWEIRKRELDNSFNSILEREMRQRVDLPTKNREKSQPRSVTPIVECFDSIKPEPIQWLWQGRIALGKVSLIVGDPGLGKSLVSTTVAAIVSRGGILPVDNVAAPKGDVVLLSAEDDPADTIRPRLDAANADVQRVHVFKAIRESFEDGKESQRLPSLQRDLSVIESVLSSLPECKLFIVDPISAYLGDADSHNNAAIRGLLAPLAEIASRLKIAVVAVSHLNKSVGSSAMYRTMGSLAFVAAARASYVVTKDNENPQRRLVLPVKNNLAKDNTGLAYTVATAENEAPVIEWEPNAIEVPADQVLSESNSEEERAASGFAVLMLEKILSDGPKSATQVYDDGEAVGLTSKQIRTAQKKLGIVPRKTSFRGEWLWELPNCEDAQDATPQAEGVLEAEGHLGGAEVPPPQTLFKVDEVKQEDIPF